MKKNAILILFLGLSSIFSAFSKCGQKSIEIIDINGNKSSNEIQIESSIYAKPNSFTSASYDTVRAISEINSATNADAYPWLSADGLRLYYTAGNSTVNQLKFTSRANTNSLFASPSIVAYNISGNTSFWFSVDELDMYVCTTNSLYYTHRNSTSSAFGANVAINLTGGPAVVSLKDASLTSNQNELYIFASLSAGTAILQFTRTSASSFAYSRSLHIPAGYTISPGQLSKDDLSIYFGATFSPNKTIIAELTRANITDTFDIATFQTIQGINDFTNYNLQPSMSNNEEWVAFTRASANSWTANDIYLAHDGTITSVFPIHDQMPAISAYPNPTKDGIFNLKFPEFGQKIYIEIYNATGAKVFQQEIEQPQNTIELSDQANGFYFVRIVSDSIHYPTLKLSKE